jgi:ribosomal protein L30E
MLGFAMRAGKVAIGTDLVITAMRAKGKNGARVVLVANDASEGTKNKLRYKAEFYKIPFYVVDAGQDELGGALGKSFSPVALAILDDRFAEEIVKAMSDTHPDR